MRKIQLAINGRFPKILPHGGILRNDGDPIDFSANSSDPEGCEDPDHTYMYVVQSYRPYNAYYHYIQEASLLLKAESFILDDGSEIPNTLYFDTPGQTYFGDTPDGNRTTICGAAAISDRIGVIKVKVRTEDLVASDYGAEYYGDLPISGWVYDNLEEAMEAAIDNSIILYNTSSDEPEA